MIHSGVVYLNNVIKTAAAATGAKYIDIEDSLDGHRLCDSGEKYVTGVVGIPVSLRNEPQESFHPNARGNFEIAMTVRDKVNNESLLEHDFCGDGRNNCPDSSATKESIPVPAYFQSVEEKNSVYKKVTSHYAKKGSPARIVTGIYALCPSSVANITLYSDPTDLGDYTVTADGLLDEEIQIPSTVPAGYHTLVVSGETYSGEPIEYEQIILVEGTDPNDIDENGIPDNQQPCGPFSIASGLDTNLNGIDDACDPYADQEPELYRVRSGDPTRTYAGIPEQENYLYVERNTRASGITGITNDYDPDGDGWAIVAASQGLPFSTTSIPDTGPVANFTVIGEGANVKPYVYIRAGGYGCVSYTPANLAVVAQGQNRTLKRVAVNTDQCRHEDPSDDLDFNGISDNEQPLYAARNGDAGRGEDPSRIYLFRSFYAAEAQLGVSDYTPTGTAAGNPYQSIQTWNLLASSAPGVYIPQFTKLVTIEDSSGKPLPIILTKKLNGACVAYKPEHTQIIKMTTQDNRRLIKLNQIPEGVSCE